MTKRTLKQFLLFSLLLVHSLVFSNAELDLNVDEISNSSDEVITRKKKRNKCLRNLIVKKSLRTCQLVVTKNSVIGGNLAVCGNLAVTGSLTFNNPVTVNSSLAVAGAIMVVSGGTTEFAKFGIESLLNIRGTIASNGTAFIASRGSGYSIGTPTAPVLIPAVGTFTSVAFAVPISFSSLTNGAPEFSAAPSITFGLEGISTSLPSVLGTGSINSVYLSATGVTNTGFILNVIALGTAITIPPTLSELLTALGTGFAVSFIAEGPRNIV